MSSCASPKTYSRPSTSPASRRAWSSSRRCTSPQESGSTTTNPAIHTDALEWLDKLAPPSWKEPANEVAGSLLPDPGDYRHHRGGEDNGDAHLKNLLVHHQVVIPVTGGRLDLGPWQAIFYAEFDGKRNKRLVIKVLGE